LSQYGIDPRAINNLGMMFHLPRGKAMANYTIPSRVTTFKINDSNSTYTLAKDNSIDTTDFGGDGITEDENFSNNTIVINGTIDVVDFDGLVLNGLYTDVTLGEDAVIQASTGINFLFEGEGGEEDGNSVTNLGQIMATTTGIYNQDFDTVIDNSGLVQGGEIGINAWFYGITITNEKGGEISGKTEALHFALISPSDTVKIVNEGEISGKIAIDCDDNQDVIINHGSIKGAIFLNGGDDSFDGRGGTTDSVIYGGAGDDMFSISASNVKLKEDADNGTDTVKSTVTCTLQDNFENLVLLGKGNIDGTGESHDNDLQGNSGKNALSGGKGDDTLSGGKGADHFVFAKGFDNDEVTDFSTKGAAHDVVDLSGSGIKSWSDLKAHHLSTSHGNAVINAGHGDVLTLDHVSSTHLNEQDFVF
jgi:Ca2+-binding RTX toxin-like protein